MNVQVRGQVAEVGTLESHLQGQHALLLVQRVVVRMMLNVAVVR